jgi:hypothetical protein
MPMAHLDDDVMIWFWQFLASVLIQDPILAILDQAQLGVRFWCPILVILPILAMSSWDLRIDIFQKNAENARFQFFVDHPRSQVSLHETTTQFYSHHSDLNIMPLYIYTPANSRLAGASFSSAGTHQFLVFFFQAAKLLPTMPPSQLPPTWHRCHFHRFFIICHYHAYQKKKTADSTSLSTSKKNESTTAGKTVSFHLRLIMRGSAIILL